MTETIQQLKEDIAVLQEKLNKLEEIEKHKSQPRMHLENEVDCSIVSFKGDIFYRLQFPDGICCWYMKTEDDYNHYKVSLEFVDDMKSKHQLESVWKNEVLIQKNTEPYYIDDTECCSGIEWDEKDNPKPMDEVVDKMLKEWEENPPEFLKFEMGKTLEALITRWWCDVFTKHDNWDMETAIDDLIDQIQLWLPKEQSAEGSQDVSVIDLVDGFNDAITKIKSKLRNKK
jgi:hypothetical protein